VSSLLGCELLCSSSTFLMPVATESTARVSLVHWLWQFFSTGSGSSSSESVMGSLRGQSSEPSVVSVVWSCESCVSHRKVKAAVYVSGDVWCALPGLACVVARLGVCEGGFGSVVVWWKICLSWVDRECCWCLFGVYGVEVGISHRKVNFGAVILLIAYAHTRVQPPSRVVRAHVYTL
jgi:hypothetical protein